MATPLQVTSVFRETRSHNIFEHEMDKRAINTFEALELLYWNEWEAACKFQDEVKQTEVMRRISALQDIIREFKTDALGR